MERVHHSEPGAMAHNVADDLVKTLVCWHLGTAGCDEIETESLDLRPEPGRLTIQLVSAFYGLGNSGAVAAEGPQWFTLDLAHSLVSGSAVLAGGCSVASRMAIELAESTNSTLRLGDHTPCHITVRKEPAGLYWAAEPMLTGFPADLDTVAAKVAERV